MNIIKLQKENKMLIKTLKKIKKLAGYSSISLEINNIYGNAYKTLKKIKENK